MHETLKIGRLGAAGDGEAATPQGPLYVPFALPGETVRVRRAGKSLQLEEVLEVSPQRIAPVCRHFGRCGGCNLQHLQWDAYCDWKTELVAGALRRQGIEAALQPLIQCRPQTRRRAVFTALRGKGGVLLGYREAASHRLVDLEECPVLLPEIAGRLPQLRELARIAAPARQPIRMAVTGTRTGLDVQIEDAGPLQETRRQALVRLALAQDLARLAVNGEILVEARKPELKVGTARLAPPPGGFLQATEEAEAAMADRVCQHLSGCRRVADLFAGAGTFALRLAARVPVHAADGDAAALAALQRAARDTPGLKPVSIEQRDLFRRPLRDAELRHYQGLVFDPPRAGAAAQAAQIAASQIRKVAAVSCNPVTLARDLAILLAGGYRINSITPLDQFLWSSHVEVIALLEK